MKKSIAQFLLCGVCVWLAGCSEPTSSVGLPPISDMKAMQDSLKEPPPPPPKLDEELQPVAEDKAVPQTGKFQVKFEASVGDFVVDVDRSWAPRGAQRFYELVKDGFYDECRFFRVVPGFMVQFGINGTPSKHKKWDLRILDDPVVESNTRATVSFATSGANSRTSQIFINYGDNSRLDDMGFSPFGIVTEGFPNVQAIYSGHGERPEQQMIELQGNDYLQQSFPELDFVKRATIISESNE